MDEEELKKLSEQVRNLSREIQKTVKATKANKDQAEKIARDKIRDCLLYTSPSPRDLSTSRMPSSA